MNPLVAAIGGSVVSGLFNQRSANKSMQFSSAQAARQMQFQDEQSRTQYQRAVADMKKAGLNPMLAAKLGGNAAMSGAMGSGAQATMPDIGSTINNAVNLRQMAPVRKAEAQLKETQARVGEMQMYEIDARINKIQQEVKNLGLDFDLKGLDLRQKKLVVAMDEALMEKGGSVYMANKSPVLNTILTSVATGAETIVDILGKGFEAASAAGKRMAPEIKKGKQIIVEILSGDK